MLPDKNELNDELIEQVGGGSSDLPELYGPASREAYGLPDILAVCLGHEDTYERTNEHSRNREPEPISKSRRDVIASAPIVSFRMPGEASAAGSRRMCWQKRKV